jgi:hypothetical protein
VARADYLFRGICIGGPFVKHADKDIFTGDVFLKDTALANAALTNIALAVTALALTRFLDILF